MNERQPPIPWSRPVTVAAIVVAVFLLSGLGSVAVVQVRAAAHRSGSQNNLRMLGIGIHTLTGAYDGTAPPSVGRFPNEASVNSTFWFFMLPFSEKDTLFSDTIRGLPPGADVPSIPVWWRWYTAPGDPTANETEPLLSYATNLAVFTRKTTNLVERLQHKGLANTIVVVERYAIVGGQRNEYWDRADFATYISGPTSEVQFGVSPLSASRDAGHAFSGGVCQVLMGDGSMSSIPPGGREAFRRACDPTVGGEP